MATLYVENVPDELYNALRKRAREKRKSISSEVVSLLEQNVVTDAQRRSRQQFFRQVARLRSSPAGKAAAFPSAEQMQREDRLR